MIDLYRRSARLIVLLASSAGLLACGSLDNASNRIVGLVTPYKVDIVQGNFVSSEQAAVLKPGATRAQVRDILGTPLLMSVFHADRWDYVFTLQRQGLPSQLRKLTVTFKGDSLDRVDAEVMPSEADFVASLDSGRPTGKVPVLELSEESLKQLPVPAKKAQQTPLPPLPTSYPPLEPATR
jgi:outer membrane protein assembly factor BamE